MVPNPKELGGNLAGVMFACGALQGSLPSSDVRRPSLQVLPTASQQPRFMLDNRSEGQNFSSVADLYVFLLPQRPDATKEGLQQLPWT